MFQTPTRATDNKVPDGTFNAWTLGLRDAPTDRTKGYPAAILPIACNVNGTWITVEKILWLPAEGNAPSVDSELVQMLCAINGVSATTETDLSALSDVLPITVQIINTVTEKANARGQMQQFHNPSINAYLPRTASADEPLPTELRRETDGSVVVVD
jgi:hypothetical protein